MSTLNTYHMIRMMQLTCFLLALCLISPSLSAVLGIDFGSELVKAAAVVPGRSFDIVLDGASKRSHPNLVVFDDDVRQYGTSASSLVTRRPQRSFLQFSRLLGKPHNTSMMDELQSYFIFNPVLADEKRHTVRFESPYYDPSQATVDVDPEEEPSPENAANILNIIASEPSISVEEVATMKLKHVKRMAEKETDGEVKDCVITVPEFWSYKERQALLDASQMAGLNVLGLINENTAAALQYALSREYEEDKTEVVIFYNMGATSTKVNVVKYFQDMTQKKSSKSKKTNPGKGAFEVLAQGWDETLGAQSFDIALSNILLERAFETLAQRKTIKEDFSDKAFQDKMRKDPRFTARIRNAAMRAKKILSANTETFVSIEGVYQDEDFKTTVTREELYERCQELFERALLPLTKAVETSGYDKADIESIVLVGGGTRIPQIRKLLTDFLDKPLKEDLNADEAPAFGAAFRAANLSSTFRVRSVGMDDITSFAVGVRLKDLRPPENEEEKAFKKRGSLFNENNHLFRRRAVTLKHGKDLRVELFYEKSAALPMDTSRDLGYYEVSGIKKAVDKYMNTEKYNITELPKVTLSFLLDANGVVDLVSATASFTEWVTEEKEVKSSKKSKKKDKETEEDSSTDTENSEESGEDAKDSEEDKEKENEEEEEEAKAETEMVQRKRTHRVDLNALRNRPEDVQAMEQSDFAHSAKILLELDERDRSVRETAHARNDLESYIFESRNRLSDETNVEKVTTSEEREQFMEQLNAAEDWIWEVEKESVSIYKTKLRELKQVGNPIFSRADEITARPTAINAAGKTLSQLYESVELLRTNYSWINATEIDKLENMTKKAETWLNKKVEEQDEKSLLEKPAFMSFEVYYKVEPIVEQAKKLLSRPKPYGWGKKKKSKNASNETSSTGDDDGEADTEAADSEDYTAKIEVDADGEQEPEDTEEDVDDTDGGDVDDDDDETEKEDL